MTSQHGLHPALVSGVLALLIVGLPVAQADSLADARNQWQSGDGRAAVRTLKHYLRQGGNDPAARALLGQVYLDLASGAAAEQELKRAIKEGRLNPTEYQTDLAQAQLLQGKYAEILEDPAVGSPTDPRKQAELHAIRGEAYLALGQPDQANEAFDKALGLIPNYPRALLGLARLAARQDDMPRARALVDQAITANPGDSTGWEGRGDLALSKRMPQPAEEAFGQAIETARATWMPLYKRALARLELEKLAEAQADIDLASQQVPQFPGLNYARGLLLLKQNQPEPALAQLNLYLPYRPEDPQALYLAGVALFQLARYQEADEYLTRACRAAPGSSTAATLLARARLARGDLKGAETALRPFADQQATNPDVLKILGEVATQDGRPGEAGALLRQALAARPDDAQTPVKLAAVLMAGGEREAAERELRALLEKNPADETAQVLLVRLLLAKPDGAAAQAQALAYLAAVPDSPRAQVALGLAQLALGDEPAARKAFARALEIKPGFADAAFNLATMERRAGRPEAARALYGQVLAVDPRDADATLLLTQLDVDAGHQAAALARVREAVTKDPANLTLRLNLAQGYQSAGQTQEALRTLQDTAPSLADDPRLLLARGQLELAAGQPFNAAATLEALVNRQPGSAQTRLLLANAYAAAKQAGAIQEHLLAGLKVDPSSPLVGPTLRNVYPALPDPAAKAALIERLLALGVPLPGLPLLQARLSLDEEKYKEAQERLGALLQSDPADREVLLLLLSAQVKASALESATATADTWLAAHPDDAEVQRLLAQIYEQRGQPQQAIETYRSLLRAQPDDPVTNNNLAMLLLEQDPAQALDYARAAARAAPADPAVGDTLGQALLAKGETQAAVQALAQASLAAPKDPTIAYHHARALLAAGEPERARAVLQPILGQPFPEEEAARTLLMQTWQ
ncbi:XrtA/PEP-CTERM system TPR-repeat protein PrsT [uncultured Thiodictyon sp.]|jgi:putative PEP-CTERM system TPR-repeat lipoprotein|uniref:XrtA/PEP-CTERM system TPR-repeat protein PrsT n=1 Tax=uncultured Thiodictyon sp. TaxID=1846217 RepID=UPI0025D79C3F|nr:XrtA/PEP-CTERM system TPR-repeat protein PrsT [uncultured Thiodictyon sp.]